MTKLQEAQNSFLLNRVLRSPLSGPGPRQPAALLFLALFVPGCGTKIADTATQPSESSSQGETDADQAASCGPTLSSRLSITTIDVDDDIRYKRPGYDLIPTDARIAYSVAPSGNSYVAWSDNALSNVHVTPLTGLQTRLGADWEISGHDIGGIVAQNDGFALLISRDDPGQALANPNFSSASTVVYGYASVLMRYSQGTPAFAAALTGTSSIAADPSNPLYDCVEQMDGRLSFNGSKYGAYFTVHMCQLPSPPYTGTSYADKMIYLNDQGQLVSGGWNWGCQIDEDSRLLPEANQFTTLCMNDSGNTGGMNLVQEGATPTLTLLAAEFATQGFCSGQFGSIVKNVNDGSYSVVWLSRGGVTGPADAPQPAKSANDIALLHLAAAPDYTPAASVTWVTNTPTINEMNLHMAAYGPDRLLVAWDNVENINCSGDPITETCFGDYTGTHFRLMDTQGNFLTPDEVLPAPPNSRDDMVIFPNGDVGWAFVPDSGRNYSDVLPTNPQTKVPLVPAIRKISIARLLYCP